MPSCRQQLHFLKTNCPSHYVVGHKKICSGTFTAKQFKGSFILTAAKAKETSFKDGLHGTLHMETCGNGNSNDVIINGNGHRHQLGSVSYCGRQRQRQKVSFAFAAVSITSATGLVLCSSMRYILVVHKTEKNI